MKRIGPTFTVLALIGLWLIGASPALASSTRSIWHISSPNHEQTFAYGTEQSRIWAERGRDRHLAVLLSFTNDPFVDRQNPRQYDNFTFAFPDVILGQDGRTFYYRSPDGHVLPVARKDRDFLGLDEIHLLPTASLDLRMPHGYLSLTLVIHDVK